jgi:hypothetical protein
MLDYDTIKDVMGLCMITYVLAYMCVLAYENEYVTHDEHAGMAAQLGRE